MLTDICLPWNPAQVSPELWTGRDYLKLGGSSAATYYPLPEGTDDQTNPLFTQFRDAMRTVAQLEPQSLYIVESWQWSFSAVLPDPDTPDAFVNNHLLRIPDDLLRTMIAYPWENVSPAPPAEMNLAAPIYAVLGVRNTDNSLASWSAQFRALDASRNYERVILANPTTEVAALLLGFGGTLPDLQRIQQLNDAAPLAAISTPGGDASAPYLLGEWNARAYRVRDPELIEAYYKRDVAR